MENISDNTMVEKDLEKKEIWITPNVKILEVDETAAGGFGTSDGPAIYS